MFTIRLFVRGENICVIVDGEVNFFNSDCKVDSGKSFTLFGDETEPGLIELSAKKVKLAST